MLEQVDNQWMQGEYLYFKDDGKPDSPEAVTRVFTVSNRVSSLYLGQVKWYAPWRRYCYFTDSFILDEKCLREVADFCELKTKAHREKRWKVAKPPFKAMLVPRS